MSTLVRVAIGIALFCATPALGQSANEFYRDKQIRLIVGSAAGSAFDIWARVISRHLPRHISGAPKLIVENMPGAGQVIATNYLYNLAPKDGSVIGMVSRSMVTAAVMDLPNIRFDPLKFNWLGSPERSFLVFFVNNNAGITSVADLFEKEVIVGGTSGTQGLTMAPVMLKNLLGMKLKIVTGYKGPDDIALAAGRGEVQAFANNVGGAEGATQRPWVASGHMRILFNFESERVPGLNLPTIFEYLKSEEQRKILTFFSNNTLIGRPLLAPPGVPQERIATLRAALTSVLQDPELIKETEKLKLEVSALSGDEITALVESLAATPPEIVKLAEKATQAE